jgi:excisionase family DNA binding protein
MMRRREKEVPDLREEKILDVTASMQGQISFKDTVNLHIQGTFEGTLQTKGQLTVGKSAQVNADIEGDTITIAGKVAGTIVARELLKVTSTGECVGEIQTAKLSVEEGGILHGHCEMIPTTSLAAEGDSLRGAERGPAGREPGGGMIHETPTPSAWKMSAEEAAQYLEVDVGTITEWAMAGKIPAIGEDGGWKFDKVALEQWVSQQKLNADPHR